MTWPEGPLEQQYKIGTGEWLDITDDVRQGEDTTITRGRPDEASASDPAAVAVMLDNRTGRYSPRNPRSDLYGLIGRNTPLRHSVRGPAPYLLVPDDADARAATAADPALDITADLDVRVELALDRLPAQYGASPPDGSVPFGRAVQTVVSRWGATPNRGWHILITQSGFADIFWSPDGTTEREIISAAVIPYTSGQRFALRCVLDVDNGAGGCTASFWTAPTLAGPWSELGEPVTVAGTTTINQSVPHPMEIGSFTGFPWPPGAGRYYAAELRDGIDGPVLASPDFTTAAPGDPSVTDAQGNVWTLSGGAEVTDYYRRGVVEVTSWPPTWDVSETDIGVPITAAGILRRLGQGQKALQSTLRRRIPSYSPLAYWPMEEDRGATQAYSPTPGVAPAAVSGLDFAADDTLGGSSPLPTVQGGATMVGTVPAPAAAQTSWHIEFVASMDSAPAGFRTVLRAQSTGTVRDWLLQIEDGAARVQGYDADGALIVNTSIGVGDDVTGGQWNRWQFRASVAGGTVAWRIAWWHVGTGGGAFSDTYSGSLGRITTVGSPTTWSTDLAGLRLGHIAVFSPQQLAAFDLADDGFTGETAITRMRRLAEEEHLPLSVLGLGSATVAMGPQRPATLLTLLQECADADGGILAERRDAMGLQYQAAALRYNLRPVLELDYAAGHIAPPLEPVDDDQTVRNDVTVNRTGGSSARAVLEDGPLSTQAPPDGIGVYDESVDVNIANDADLNGLAWWRLHLGTVDEMRYPTVTLNLRSSGMQPFLQAYLDRMDVGARITIANPPDWLPPDTIDLIVQGYTETLSQFHWTVTLTCTPASPWTVGQVAGSTASGVGPSHLGTAEAELAVPAGVADTALTVQTTGPLWTTSLADFPHDIVIGGERMTVTAAVGDASPQTLTVTRAVNGIAKSHEAGAVRIATPVIVAL